MTEWDTVFPPEPNRDEKNARRWRGNLFPRFASPLHWMEKS
jgi:hypothetical protein